MPPRVIGIDPGTVSIDLCGLDGGRVFLDRSLPTRDALADPASLVAALEEAAPVDLVAGPSGYGLPLTAARDLTEADLGLAYLAAAGEAGGIGGLRSLMRALARSSLPVVLTPGVVHLPTVPAYRKVNRVDMGTADKVCAVVLALHELSGRQHCAPHEVSFILLELGGAFTAAIAVEQGRIVDGLGGTSGALGGRASGALDGEVAFLAGEVTKDLLFHGGASEIADMPDASLDALAEADTPRAKLAWEAYLESAVKAVAALAVTMRRVPGVVLSGRLARSPAVRDQLRIRLAHVTPDADVHGLTGFASTAKQAAQGAALLADGLAGGASAPLVAALGLRDAAGTVLDHLYVIAPADARRRLGI
jgi:predicted butyrate kinase (DUF1464 family)